MYCTTPTIIPGLSFRVFGRLPNFSDFPDKRLRANRLIRALSRSGLTFERPRLQSLDPMQTDRDANRFRIFRFSLFRCSRGQPQRWFRLVYLKKKKIETTKSNIFLRKSILQLLCEPNDKQKIIKLVDVKTANCLNYDCFKKLLILF